MIPISYDNVMNGLNKSLNMQLLCPTRQEAYYIFQRAVDLWHIEGFTQVTKTNLSIKYGAVYMQFKVFEATHNDSWRGFRGVFMLHPAITPETIMPRFQKMLEEMEWHNERYMESWRP